MPKNDPGFVAGIAYALATLNKLYDQPTMCAAVLSESGLKVEDFRHVDDFDGQEIRRIYRQEHFIIGNHKHVMAMRDAPTQEGQSK